MENMNYELPTLDLTARKEEPLETPEAISDTPENAPVPQDTRSCKEKLTAAIEQEKAVFIEDAEYNKAYLKERAEEIKSRASELIESLKCKVKSLPEKAKTFAKSLPERAKHGAKNQFMRMKNFKLSKKNVKTGITVALLGIWALIVLFPFYFMIITSLKSYGGFNSEMDIISKLFVTSPTFESYVTAFSAVDLAKYFANTLVFTLVTTGIMLIVTVLASYGFARINFKGKNLVFTAFLSMMMIPAELVIITNYITVTNLDMRNTLMGLVLPSVTSVFYIYLLKENFQQVPNELYYAAKVDGTTDLKYLFKVMMPICQPTIVTVTILKVIECWNSYVWPRLVTDDETKYLISNGIQAIREGGFGRDNIPAMMAAVVSVSIPLILLFLIFRNKIMEGVARGGTKG